MYCVYVYRHIFIYLKLCIKKSFPIKDVYKNKREKEKRARMRFSENKTQIQYSYLYHKSNNLKSPGVGSQSSPHHLAFI